MLAVFQSGSQDGNSSQVMVPSISPMLPRKTSLGLHWAGLAEALPATETKRRIKSTDCPIDANQLKSMVKTNMNGFALALKCFGERRWWSVPPPYATLCGVRLPLECALILT